MFCVVIIRYVRLDFMLFLCVVWECFIEDLRAFSIGLVGGLFGWPVDKRG